MDRNSPSTALPTFAKATELLYPPSLRGGNLITNQALMTQGGTEMTTTSQSHIPHRLTAPPTSRWYRPTVNIAVSERAGRIVLGVAAVVVGAILLASARSALAVVLEVLLVGAGLDLTVTGALGHCPLYAQLGHIPPSLRSPS